MGIAKRDKIGTNSVSEISAIDSGPGSQPLGSSYFTLVRASWMELSRAQKGTSKSAPAYSRYINRRLGRAFAALAAPTGISPNQITLISAVATFAGVFLIAGAPISVPGGFLISLLLVLGYALDSTDGQVARLQGSGSIAGEWLDHCVDAIKTTALPLAVAVGLWRSGSQPEWVPFVALIGCVVASTTFFLMILTEQFRLRMGAAGLNTAKNGSGSGLRGWLVLPMDYGVMCLIFVLWGWSNLFVVVYALITVGATAFLVLAIFKWYRDVKTLVADSKAGPRHG